MEGESDYVIKITPDLMNSKKTNVINCDKLLTH